MRAGPLTDPDVQITAGNCFCARRTGNGQNADVRRGVRGYAAKDAISGVRDLLWAMLNTREFAVNH